MENISDGNPDLLPSTQLEVNEESSTHLKDAGIWARTIAIILCVICGLGIIAIGFFGTIFGGSAFAYRGSGYIGGLIIGALIVIGLALLFIINLFRFHSGISGGIANQDEAEFEKGVTGLRNYFICSGVLALILCLFYFVQLIS